MRKSIKLALTFTLLIILIGVILYFYIDNKLNSAYFYEGIFVDGIELSDYSREEAVELLEGKKQKEIESKKMTILSERNKEFEYILPLKDLGYDFNYEKAIDEAHSTGREGSFVERLKFIKNLKKDPVNIELMYYYDPNLIDKHIDEISKTLYEEPKDATLKFDRTKFHVTDEVIGYEVNKALLKSMIESNIDQLNDIYVPYDEIEPKTTAKLYNKVNGLLAHFSTSFKSSASGRINNIILSANSFKGKIVLPGEVVSYNKTTGPRNSKNGYEDAPVIVNGELTPGIGGGVCQTSTTLYNALLLADLEILERHPHSIPPAYVPKGTDAAVAGTYYDLVFKNNFDFPIYIDTKIINKTVHFYIYGDAANRDYKIKIGTKLLETIPYKTVEKLNTDLEPGTRNLVQEGRNGYKVATYKYKIVNGNVIETIKISSDYYKEKDYIYEVGPEKEDPEEIPTTDQNF